MQHINTCAMISEPSRCAHSSILEMSISSSSTLTSERSNTLMEKQDSLEHGVPSISQRKREMLEKYSLPLHWQPPSASLRLGRLWQVVFKTLCICAYGEPNLESLWASIKLAEDGDDTVWEEEQKRACEQQSNILVLVRPRGCLLIVLSS